jgi:hypothetical protein
MRKMKVFNVLLGLGMFAWLLYNTSLFNAIVGTMAWAVIMYALNRFQRPKRAPQSQSVKYDAGENGDFEEEERRLLAWLRRNLDLEDDAELQSLLQEIEGEERSRCVEFIMEAVMNGEEIDPAKEEEIIIRLIAEEFLPDAYLRRDCVGEMSKIAEDPVLLWKEYKEAETEDLDEFIDEIEATIKNFRKHSGIVKGLGPSN